MEQVRRIKTNIPLPYMLDQGSRLSREIYGSPPSRMTEPQCSWSALLTRKEDEDEISGQQ